MKPNCNRKTESQPLKEMTDKGFFFAGEEEEALGIYTRNNRDGTISKQLLLPVSGHVALVRQVNNRDTNEIYHLGTTEEQYAVVMLSLCTMLDGKRASLSEIEDIPLEDLNRLIAAFTSLNMKDWKNVLHNAYRQVLVMIRRKPE